ncbi:MAG: hypothetical protein K1X44_00055 [Alphaproteobacteria bacterium]|nr:hypothetical protein [Alphaproteobacteria bacterium]
MKQSMIEDFPKIVQEKYNYINRHNGKFRLADCDICIPVNEPKGIQYYKVENRSTIISSLINYIIFKTTINHICQNSNQGCPTLIDQQDYNDIAIVISDPRTIITEAMVGILDDLYGTDNLTSIWKKEESTFLYPRDKLVNNLFGTDSVISQWHKPENLFDYDLYRIDAKDYLKKPRRYQTFAGYDHQSNRIFVKCDEDQKGMCQFFTRLKDKNVDVYYNLPRQYLPDWHTVNDFILNFAFCNKGNG